MESYRAKELTMRRTRGSFIYSCSGGALNKPLKKITQHIMALARSRNARWASETGLVAFMTRSGVSVPSSFKAQRLTVS